jgi:GDSL-like lipase/acylhydrolase family protein
VRRRGARLLSIAAFLAGLSTAEVIGRRVLPNEILPVVPSTNLRLIYELNPRYPGINSFGMRQEELDLRTLHDRFVIAMIGDSHVYSVGSADASHSLPARLASHLNAQRRPVRVLNFGVPGYDMVQELETLRAKVLRWKPDLVVLVYCVNDEHLPNYIQPKFPRLNRLLHASVLVTRAWKDVLYSEVGGRHLKPRVEEWAPDLLLFAPGLVGAPASRDADPAHGPQHPSRSADLTPSRYRQFIGRANLERAVREFGEICRRSLIPAVASGFIEEPDAAVYRASGFDVLSFFEIFQGRDMRRYGYDPDHTETHFDDRGNDVVGRALAAYLAERVPLATPRN